MIKYFCDCCGKEGNTSPVEIPCHAWSKSMANGYVDNDGNPVSGRSDRVDLCNACKNDFYYAAVKAIGGSRA